MRSSKSIFLTYDIFNLQWVYWIITSLLVKENCSFKLIAAGFCFNICPFLENGQGELGKHLGLFQMECSIEVCQVPLVYGVWSLLFTFLFCQWLYPILKISIISSSSCWVACFSFHFCHGGLMSFKALLLGTIIVFIVMHLWRDKVLTVEISFFSC